MSLRDYRLTAAARSWGKARLQPPANADRAGWLDKRVAKVNRRAKRARAAGGKGAR
jgi:hypothetical protein